MRLYAYVRRGARAGICVLALSATAASAQQAPTENPPAAAAQPAPAATTPSDGAAPAPATAPATTEPTSNLPELVVNDDAQKKKKKAVAVKQETVAAPSSSAAEAEAATKPPTTTLGTGAPADIGTTTFDASAVQMR